MKKFTLLMAAALMGTAAADAATVYFEDTANWGTVKVWQWDGADANNQGQWPGNTVLTETATKDGKTYYKHETECKSIIFLNEDGSSQTQTQKVTNNMIYNANGETGESFEGGTIVVGKDVYLAGTFNSFNGSDDNYKFTTTDQKNYTLSVEGEFSSNFAIVVNGAWFSTTDKVESGAEYVLSEIPFNNCEFSVATVKNLSITYNVDSKVMVATYEAVQGPGPQPVGPEHVYLIGDVNGTGWSTSASPEMTKEGDLYKITDVTIDDAGEGFGYISMITRLASSWDGDEAEPGVNSSDRFGAPAADTVLELSATETTSAPVTLYAAGVNASSAPSWKIAAGNKYAFTFNYPEMTLTVTKTSGVEAIEAEDGNAVYYNLQGVRVDNPENGIFIRVANGKSVKVAK